MKLPVYLPRGAAPETIQNVVFEVGKDAGYEPLRAWFGTRYEVLLGQTQGPVSAPSRPFSGWIGPSR